ncbi:MAG: DNA gyrase/topoisomerase IV subunit A [Saprospiraceae bacterium]|nr:DNA gyrase/topoisomerase IV subunit A [Bacteroidia bacterium]NNE15653.1 DNA gyrase/topoisomerase IV subunit A [Saprospiraceae bacterium]NNL92403.1 DNA gyrase/topoisomerase IV subunit A [Saprospiraceae bacterium]
MSKVTEIDIEEGGLISLEGMYKEYFLDYASYVILERAVPNVEDGLKPVQRRILHSMKRMDDGRFHKVANVIGQTMQYHPHGDAAIGAALVNLGQKDLLIETQGNWGDYRTGDSAAAPRYIEARLTKFALEVAFNAQTTEWQVSYDGRNKEPITLPMKFPMVLAQGVEGIAVGLSTKILPHNFIELIKASIKILQEKRFKIYPDFPTGGLIDVRDYSNGKRGGKVKVRAKIEQRDKKTLAITELPYGVTTNSLIDSILKANDKGKIQIKKVIDNTAADVEILLELPSGVSPDVSLDALYAFTNCEVSISPNAVVISDNKPIFCSIEDLLKISTENTKDLLRQELEIKKGELEEKWHGISLEKIFIENRIYRDIEEAESFEEVIKIIAKGLKKYVATPSDKAKKGDKRLSLNRDITQDDIVKLTEIKIKKISKYNKFKTDELLKNIEEELKQVKFDLKHLTDFAINYFETLLSKYGKGKERRTEITEFDTIKVTRVAAKNAKLYVDRKEGFIGTSLKKEEFVTECSDIDNIIAFTKAGTMKVVKIGDKVFMGKNILHTNVWKKGDDRTTYNMIYIDAIKGRAMAKRFNVKSITRDKDYDLTTGHKNNKCVYFAAHPNGETETVQIQLTAGCKAKKKVFEFDFGSIEIKGRGSKGNIVTKYPVRKVTQLEVGSSSLGAQKIWIDEVSGRLNKEERGKYLGEFDTGDKIIAVYKNGTYQTTDLNFDKKFDAQNLVEITKIKADTVVNCVYFEGEKGWTMVKRFVPEVKSGDVEQLFITDHPSSKLYLATTSVYPTIHYSFKKGKELQEYELELAGFMDVKGVKAIGNKLGEFKILKIRELENEEKTNLSPGDTIELDF